MYYNEVALGRWLEQEILRCGVRTILGTVLQRAVVADGRIDSIQLASRYGDVRVTAAGFVDASGDAALTWMAGLPCWVPERPIYGSQQVIVENVDETHQPGPGEIDQAIAAKGEERGLLRRGGLAFFFPGRGTAVLNDRARPWARRPRTRWISRAAAARTTSTWTGCAGGWRPISASRAPVTRR